MTFLGPHAHVGFVVPDLAEACREVGDALGLTWARIRSRTATVRSLDGGAEVPFTVTYSREGPPYVELIQEVPDTLWAMQGSSQPHHLGYWSDDVSGMSDMLARAGAPWVAESSHERGGGLRWAYHDHRTLGLVELVDVARRPAVEAWIRGEGDGET